MSNSGKMTMNMLDGQCIRVFTDEHGQISLEDKTEGVLYHNVEVILLFPLTKRRSYIQFSTQDEDEIGILRNMKRLDEESKAALTAELEKNYFIPSISKIHAIDTKLGADAWHVETKKGDRTFEVTGKRRNIRFYPDGLVVIKDIDGNRYEIQDISALDATSRKILEREL